MLEHNADEKLKWDSVRKRMIEANDLTISELFDKLKNSINELPDELLDRLSHLANAETVFRAIDRGDMKEREIPTIVDDKTADEKKAEEQAEKRLIRHDEMLEEKRREFSEMRADLQKKYGDAE